jgi:nuclear migration protein JNM1
VIGDLSDEEDESLERKLARLRREIEEVKEEVGKRNAEQETDAGTTEGDGSESREVDGLSDVLDGLRVGINGTNEGAQTTLAKKLGSGLKYNGKLSTSPQDLQPLSESTAGSTNYVVSYAPSYAPSHALAKAAAFDSRLTLLEKLLGLSNPSLPPETSRPILPALDQLTSQLTALSTTSASSLDTLSRRVRQLTTEAETLTEKRRLAEGQGVDETAPKTNGNPRKDSVRDTEQSTKINALFGSLSTIENLHPLLPALLERLRSLRKLHGEAASVAENLDSVEKRQTEMSAEIERWREGLEKVETAVVSGEKLLKGNVGVVEGWVKGLEERMQKLG